MSVTLRLLAVSLASTAAMAQAEEQSSRSFVSPRQASPSLERQLALPENLEQTSRPSAFIASLAVAPNATIGVGRFYVLPRRRVSVQDQPVTLERKPSRRAAVGLSLRF